LEGWVGLEVGKRGRKKNRCFVYVEGKLRGRFRVEMVRKSGRKSEMLKIETSFRFY